MKLIIFFLLSLTCFVLNAEQFPAVRASFKAALPNTKVDAISLSEIPDLFRITSGANVFYYNPEKRLLVFGEIMTTDGHNLTSSHRHKARSHSLADMEASALTIQYGEPLNVIYEFSNPECGVCKRYEEFLAANPLENTVRHIFFLGWTPQARKKLEHIHCSADPKRQMHAIYGGADVTEFASCEQGKNRVLQHDQYARELGVRGTPTLIVNGQKLAGFQPGKLLKLLKREKTNDSTIVNVASN